MKTPANVCLVILFSLFWSVSVAQSLELTDSSGRLVEIQSVINKKPISVFVFYSPDCPLCQSYSSTLSKLSEELGNYSIAYTVVFSHLYSKDEILKFYEDYHFSWSYYIDKNYLFAKYVKAQVTPEAVVFYKNKIAYQGAVNNKMEKLSHKRTVVTKHYLHQALLELKNGKKPSLPKTEAVGCFLEY